MTEETPYGRYGYPSPGEAKGSWNETPERIWAQQEIEIADEVETWENLPDPDPDAVTDDGQRRVYRIVEDKVFARDDGASWTIIGGTGSPERPLPDVHAGSVSTEYTDTEWVATRRNVLKRQDSNRHLSTSRGTSGPFDPLAMTFEDESWWTTSFDPDIDTDVFYRGSQSVKYDLDAGDRFLTNYGFDPVDISGLMPSFAIRRENTTDTTDVRVFVRDSSGDSASYHTRLLGNNYRPLKNWFRVDLGPTDSGADLTDIVDLSIQIREGESGKVWLDDLRWIPIRERGAMIFMFDGTQQSVFDNAYPILDKYGLTGTIAVSNNLFEGSGMSEEQLEDLWMSGWEIGVHSNAAQATDGIDSGEVRGISEEEMHKRLDAAKRNVMELGFSDVNYIVTLQNGFDSTFLDVAPTYFDLAWGSGNTGQPRSTTTSGATNPWALNRTRTDSTGIIDVVNDIGGVHTSYWHNVEDGGEITPTDFETLVEYVANADVDVINPSRLVMERGTY